MCELSGRPRMGRKLAEAAASEHAPVVRAFRPVIERRTRQVRCGQLSSGLDATAGLKSTPIGFELVSVSSRTLQRRLPRRVLIRAPATRFENGNNSSFCQVGDLRNDSSQLTQGCMCKMSLKVIAQLPPNFRRRGRATGRTTCDKKGPEIFRAVAIRPRWGKPKYTPYFVNVNIYFF